METNVYQAPESDLQQEEAVSQQFYIVSKSKFLILFIATFGIYNIYWFYRHWSHYRQVTGENMLPAMRSIFSVFFAHSLFSKIDGRIRESGHSYKWFPGTMATIYVAAMVVGNIYDLFSRNSDQFSVVDLIGFLTFPIIGWTLFEAQKAANIACDDPDGESNASMTPANYIWIVLGLLVWIVMGIGIYDITVGLPV